MSALRRVLPFLTKVWFRYELRGLDRIPEPPCLFVANHSGLGVAEVLCMVAAWEERFGRSRPIHGLAHDALFRVPVLRDWMRAIEAVPASAANAREALDSGHDVIVFPGGELDAGRPFWKAREVIFGERRGYLELARRASVPIVPVATIGSHLTYLVVPGGALLARALRLRRLLRLERVPLPAGLLLGAATLPLAPLLGAALLALGAIPNPVAITSELLAPIRLDPALDVEEAHALVHGALSDAVRRLERGKPLQEMEAPRVSRAGRRVGARTGRRAA